MTHTTHMSLADEGVALVLGVFLYLGGYRPYFLLQRSTIERSRVLPSWASALDERIPLRAGWVWVYTVLYYPVVVLAGVLTSPDLRRFAYTAAFSFALLAALSVGYFFTPVKTPDHWRHYEPRQSIHHRFLRWVQKHDDANNCFPSGHAAISVFAAYLLSGLVGPALAAAFALAVCLSCLFCKQHYIVDVLGGCVVGGLCAFCHQFVVG